jgi:DUF1680 family protein
LVESLGNYIYGSNDQNIWINLFVGSNTTVPVVGQQVPVTMKTNYPWDGQVEIAVSPQKKTKFILRIRKPGWVSGEAVPGGLYTFQDETAGNVSVMLNGQAVKYTMDKGYMLIEREWNPGDKVTVDLPMDVKRVSSRTEVKANIERVAIQRGPMIYCVEGADNAGHAVNIVLPKSSLFTVMKQTVLTEPVVSIQTDATVLTVSPNGDDVKTEKKKITAVPYYTWNNRGSGQMLVWLPQRILDVKVN